MLVKHRKMGVWVRQGSIQVCDLRCPFEKQPSFHCLELFNKVGRGGVGRGHGDGAHNLIDICNSVLKTYFFCTTDLSTLS